MVFELDVVDAVSGEALLWEGVGGGHIGVVLVFVG
jgi:hypothetical protein